MFTNTSLLFGSIILLFATIIVWQHGKHRRLQESYEGVHAGLRYYQELTALANQTTQYQARRLEVQRERLSEDEARLTRIEYLMNGLYRPEFSLN